jgi:rRNA maturation endonuclease Nob1
MIRLSISNIIFLYIICSVIITLAVWVAANYRRDRKAVVKGLEHIWKCSVCFNDYIDSKHDAISVCPVCGSYNKKDEEKGVRG